MLLPWIERKLVSHIIKEINKKSYLVIQREIFANLKISSVEKKCFVSIEKI